MSVLPLTTDICGQIARERFALTNGWKFTRTDFTLDALIKGLYSGGRNDSLLIRPEYGNPFQHRESFRVMPPQADMFTG
jgi:hypothetical protein